MLIKQMDYLQIVTLAISNMNTIVYLTVKNIVKKYNTKNYGRNNLHTNYPVVICQLLKDLNNLCISFKSSQKISTAL